MSHPPGTSKVIYKNMMVIDSGRGITLRFGGGAVDDSSAFVYNVYINPVSRMNCTYCYGHGAIPCSWRQGVRLLTTTVNG